MRHFIISGRIRALPAILIFLLLSETAFAAPIADNAAVSSDPTSLTETEGSPLALPLFPAGLSDPFALAAPAGQTAAPSVDPTVEPKKASVPSIGAYGKAFLPDLADGTKRIFSPDIAPVALVGLGLTALAFTVDHRVQDYFQNNKPIENRANTGDKMGQGYIHVGIGFALFGVGEALDNKRLADTGVVTLEALLVNGIATEVLKHAISRDRPNGENDMSFPSGHASSTATLAASVSEMYDWDLRIAVPLYMVTAFVGASRIQANEHHLSDVVAGITLGTVVGMSFARSRKEKNEAGTGGNISVMPFFDGTHKGVVFNWRF